MNFGQTSYGAKGAGARITLPFPNALFESLCKQHNLDPGSGIELNAAASIFRSVLQQWQEGSISTEDLSSISNFMLGKIGWENDLSDKLEYASEMSYYIRAASDEQSGIVLSKFIKTLTTWLKESTE